MRILVAYDASPTAQEACRLIDHAAWPDGSTVDVLTCFEPNVPNTLWAIGAVDPNGSQDAYDAEREAARDTAREGAQLIRRPELAVTARIAEGRTATAILDVAAELHADLLVAGTRGLGPLRSSILGSVSSELVENATCPVLVVRGPAVGRVLLAYDDSGPARHAVRLLAGWPMFQHCPVRVVTVAPRSHRPGEADLLVPAVVPPVGDGSDDLRATAAEIASRAVDPLRAAGLEVDVDVRVDHAAHAIVCAASEWHADLIVTGRSGHGLVNRLLIGSVARNVLHHAPCSVLVVHAPAKVEGPAGVEVPVTASA